ncbi:hypothetical protein CDIK_2731 [Cucumispora dikerogammari]|nr:hypothetical protein CDIK_2731 [Cucumispora dikerogammari]
MNNSIVLIETQGYLLDGACFYYDIEPVVEFSVKYEELLQILKLYDVESAGLIRRRIDSTNIVLNKTGVISKYDQSLYTPIYAFCKRKSYTIKPQNAKQNTFYWYTCKTNPSPYSL